MVYASFSDESGHSQGRYRSIATVSLPADSVVPLSDRLLNVLDCDGRGEFKWGRVGYRGARDVDRAIAAIDFLLENLIRDVRADVLTWDTQDERHSVPDRDDTANYERMFYHLHRTLMKRRGLESVWHMRPDEQVTIDWGTIGQCLNSRGTWRHNLDLSSLSEELRSFVPDVKTFRTVDSANTPLCQLADLFAGMAAYTRTSADIVKSLMGDRPGQGNLFETPDCLHPTRRDRARFRVIDHLYQQCKRRRMGVSLRECGYFRTYDPKQPLNFWHYEPQHVRDRAPRKLSVVTFQGTSKGEATLNKMPDINKAEAARLG